MRDEAYRELRDLIVEGTLRPGERLRDKDIAAWLQVSRTPVREALTRLSDDGLVEMAPNRYTRVRPIRLRDAIEGYPLVAALHALATEQAAPALRADEQLAALREDAEAFSWALLREDTTELVRADDAFHGRILAIAGNTHLTAGVERLAPRLRQAELTLGIQAAADRSDVHGAVIAALRENEAAAAAALVIGEWRGLGVLVVEQLSRAGPAAG